MYNNEIQCVQIFVSPHVISGYMKYLDNYSKIHEWPVCPDVGSLLFFFYLWLLQLPYLSLD